MKRKLLLLNLALVALLAYTGWQLRQEYLAAKARDAAELSRKIKPGAPPPFTPFAQPGQVAPASYADIAQQMLFDKSRNPDVVIETPKPPPKPMPALPLYHGQMQFSDGLIAIFSQTSTAPHEAVHIGDQIGQFKLVDVNKDEIVFEWDGKPVRKKVDELLEHKVEADLPAVAVARTEAPAAPAAPPPPATPGPGADNGAGARLCNAGDPSPAGAVVDGFRKVVAPTPFGNICRWDPVGR